MNHHRRTGRLSGALLGAALWWACGLACAAETAPAAPPLARWGGEVLAQIEKDLRVAGSDLYAEVRTPDGRRGNGQFGPYSFVWPAGFQLRALAAAAQVQPGTYRRRLLRFADALEKYWHEEDGLGGYMVLTSRSERFHDDNAWLLIGLIETWRVTREGRFLDRAKRIVPLLLDGEKKTPGGGIRQREGKEGGAFTCTTAPAAVGVLELYRITGKADYLRMGERWQAWLTDRRVGVQDAATGLYHQGALWTGTEWKVKLGYRAYQSALPMQAAILLSRIKRGDAGRAHLAEAQRIARSAVAKWVKPGGALAETAQWGGSDLVDALLDLYDVDRDPRWLTAVYDVLRYAHDRGRDPNGRYGEDWNVDRRDRPVEECKLLYMAPVARAYWRAARYERRQGPATKAALPAVRVSEDRRGFVLAGAGERFTPWGFNYDHDERGRLIEDYWQSEWDKVAADFAEMKALGANVVRVHLQLGKFMAGPDRPNADALEQLARLVALAEQTGLYLDVTGLGCYHKKDVPAWYDALGEADRWAVQERFWQAVAAACAASPAVFCYDLMNEPILPGAGKKETDWLAGEFAGKYFVQRISLDLAGRTREQVAAAWVDRLVAAIRKHDRARPITVGVIPWALTFPGAKPLFYSPRVGRNLDFVSVHFYPEKGKVDQALKALAVYDVGKPIVIEETFPLKCSAKELEAFLDGSAKLAAGWLSFYWGKDRDELARSGTIADAILLQWLNVFSRRAQRLGAALGIP